MRVRKKPDLRIDIPSYPSDYVEMPPETRRVIESLTPNNTPCSPGLSPPRVSYPDSIREGTRTPEVRIVGPEDTTDEVKVEKELKDAASAEDSPIVYRRANKGALETEDFKIVAEKIRKDGLNVSFLFSSIILGFLIQKGTFTMSLFRLVANLNK